MKPITIHNCPGTLVANHDTYSRTCLKRMFDNKKVHHILPYFSPVAQDESYNIYLENLKRISISGVQEKFSITLDKNKLRLINENETGTYILKPTPKIGKNLDQMPANEHLTMQIARQIYGIDTAENALIFFKDGEIAYLTKRFDVNTDKTKRAVEDFASLGARIPQTHGSNYKYAGNYSELFTLMKKFLPAYRIEAQKMYKLLLFNYLFSNGDAHFKNFSVIETPQGDFNLSPAYDLLNTRIHVDDSDFALDDGLLPKNLKKGKIKQQFLSLANFAELTDGQINQVHNKMFSNVDKVKHLIDASYLNDKLKRNYLQAFQTRLKKFNR